MMVHSRNWSLTGGTLTFHHPRMNVFWDMPEDFQMPSESVLSLVEFILLKPYGENVDIVPAPQKRRGRVAVAFSGGTDSAAALRLVPDPIPVYTQVANVRGMHNIENALLALKEVGGISVVSNYAEFPTAFGKRNGYFGHGAFTLTCILMSEYHDIKTACDGNVLEMAYLAQGTRYHAWDQGYIFHAFERAGLQYCMPCAGLTEVSTTRMAEGYRYAMGCMRGRDGTPCNNCVKCFRKNALRGDPIATNTEVEKKLSGDIIPMLPSLLWARDHKGLRHKAIANVDKDIEWVDKWYPHSLELIPPDLHEHICGRLQAFGIETLTQTASLENWISR